MKHNLRVKGYLRYGDDFVLFGESRSALEARRDAVRFFLLQELHLTLHDRNDVICPCGRGLRFLGCHIFPTHRHLKRQTWSRAWQRTNLRNVSSYSGLVRAHSDQAARKQFAWHILGLLDDF